MDDAGRYQGSQGSRSVFAVRPVPLALAFRLQMMPPRLIGRAVALPSPRSVEYENGRGICSDLVYRAEHGQVGRLVQGAPEVLQL